MPYDIVAANFRATQVGAALGQAMFNNSLRMQQLQSEQAMQRLQQQQAAEMLSWTMRQHHEAIDKEADDAKRSAAFQAMITPTLSIPLPNPGPDTEGMSPLIGPDGQPMGGTGPSISGSVKQVPNPIYTPDWGEAYFKAMAGSKEPISKIAVTAGALSLHQAQAAKAKADAAQFGAGGMQPQAVQVKDPTTGEMRTMFQTGPRSWQLAQESASKRMFDKFTLQEQGKMLDMVRKDRPDLYSSLPVDERGNKYVPDSTVDQVAKQAGITTANRTKLEGEEIGADNVFALGKELLPLINENTTGARAELTRFLQRRGITTLFPSLDNTEISVAEAVGKRFTSGVVKALKSDGNIGVQEQQAIEHAAETINWTTAASGKAKLGAIVSQAADMSRRAALKKGTPINPLFLSRSEIRARLEAGDYGDPNSLEAGKNAEAAFNNTAESFLSQIKQQIK